MIIERKHGESWSATLCRYASLDRIPSSKVYPVFTELVEEGYSEERAVWLVLMKYGVL